MIERLKARELRVEEYWVGGGGNWASEDGGDEGRCRAMSLEWIKNNVEEMITTEDWKPGNGWERVNFA